MSELPSELGPELIRALEAKGYATLTPVQAAVLRAELAGRDLRITSQTGSGKTVAVGIAVRDVVANRDAGAPRALVITPTRELAKQVEQELRWLFAPLGAEVTSVTGGASYRDEYRALSRKPAIVVGTPGRLRDHLERGGLSTAAVGAVILDEADRMLDMGFKEEIDAILAKAPAERRTILVSATFPREVRALADRVQKDPAFVEGTPLGAANADIEHLIHVVQPRERLDAIVNLLLASPDAPSLVFVRTRADVAELSGLLQSAGFSVGSLSGDMEQPERDRALAAFKRGAIHALVATDVAARGIDVQDIGRVIHAEPPNDADTYTHRSGRTGRAGRQGVSSVLAAPAALRRVTGLLSRAKVRWKVAPVPTAEELRNAATERLFVELTKDAPDEIDESIWNLAKRLGKEETRTRILARLLSRGRLFGAAEPRDVRPTMVQAPVDRGPAPPRREFEQRPRRDDGPRARHDDAPRPRRDDAPRPRREVPLPDAPGAWTKFRVTWGGLHGADARRVLAMLCRRGGIQGADIGAIAVERTYSIVDVAASVADRFADAAAQPDPRDPRVKVFREQGGAPPPRRSSRKLPEAAPDDVPPPRKSARKLDAEAPAAPPPRKSARKLDAPKPMGGGHVIRRGPKKPHRKGQPRPR
jgi:ATP-dependent RNA helicase DeaD